MLGNLNAAMLTISRLPYAMAAAGQLPRALAVIHPRFRTPYVALIFSGLLMLANLAAARFVLPGGLAIPSAAIALIAWLLASSSFAATRDVAILTLIGALLYAIGRRHERQSVT
jgi:amino acid transporter